MLPANRAYPGSASLFQDIGKKIIVHVRGNRTYIGYLRIVDQFGNIVLHEAVERIHVQNKFCDVPQGLLLLRGDCIILMGDMKPDLNIEDHLQRVSEAEIYVLREEQTAARKELMKKKAQLFAGRSLAITDLGDILFDDM